MKSCFSVLALCLFFMCSCEQNTHVKTTRTVDESGNTIDEKTTTTKEIGPDKDRLENVGDKLENTGEKIEERAKEVGQDIREEAAEAKADYKKRRDSHDTIVVKKETTHTVKKK